MNNSNSSLYQPEFFTGDISTSSDSGIIPVNPIIETNIGDLSYSSSQAQADFQENLNVPEPEDNKTKMFCKIPFLNLRRMDVSQTEQQNEMTRNGLKNLTQWFQRFSIEKKESEGRPIGEISESRPIAEGTGTGSFSFSIGNRVFSYRRKARSTAGSSLAPSPRDVSLASSNARSTAGSSLSPSPRDRSHRLSLPNFMGGRPLADFQPFRGWGGHKSLESRSSSSVEAHRHSESHEVDALKNYAINSNSNGITASLEARLKELHRSNLPLFEELLEAATKNLHQMIQCAKKFDIYFKEETSNQLSLMVDPSPAPDGPAPLYEPLKVTDLSKKAAEEARKKVNLKITYSNYLFKTLKIEFSKADQTFMFLKRAFDKPVIENGQIIPLFLQSTNSYLKNNEIRKTLSLSIKDSVFDAKGDQLLIDYLKPVKEGCVQLLELHGETEMTRALIERFFRNILQFGAHAKDNNIETDHFYIHTWVVGLHYLSFAFDDNYLSSQATSVLTSKTTNKMKGLPGNRDLPKGKQYIKLLGLENYLFALFQHSMADDSVRLSLQLDLQKYKYSNPLNKKDRSNKKYCTRAEKLARNLVITKKDFPKLKKKIFTTADQVDFTDDEVNEKISDLMDSARCEAADMSDRLTKESNGEGDSYDTPIYMQYLLAYLHVKGGIIQYLFAESTNPLLNLDDFRLVEDQLNFYFQEINTFQFVLEKATNQNHDDFIEEQLKNKFKCSLRDFVKFDTDHNEIVKRFQTRNKFIAWLDEASAKTNIFADFESNKEDAKKLATNLLDISFNFPITARTEKALLGENYSVSRTKESNYTANKKGSKNG